MPGSAIQNTRGIDAISKMMNVDFIISPERIVAEKMIKIAEMENLVDWEELPGMDVSLRKIPDIWSVQSCFQLVHNAAPYPRRMQDSRNPS